MIKFLLGESFHPGGLILTGELLAKLHLNENSKVLDIACGIGTTSIDIAQKYGCQVIGIDLSCENIAFAIRKAEEHNLSKLLSFQVADAQSLPFPKNYFDAVISECSFCIFPDKKTVAKEMYRVTKQGGYLGISDVVVEKELPQKFEEMVYRVACLSGAQSTSDYLSYLSGSGFTSLKVDDRGSKLLDLHKSIKVKLLLLEMTKNINHPKLENINLGGVNFTQINEIVDYIKHFVDNGFGSYVIITGRKI